MECMDLPLAGHLCFLGMGFLGNREEGKGKKKGGSDNDSST